jgi:hypothetical protein
MKHCTQQLDLIVARWMAEISGEKIITIVLKKEIWVHKVGR